MALFNQHKYGMFFGKSLFDLGLRVCPYNPNHKVKYTKYQMHIAKCEKQWKSILAEKDLLAKQQVSATSEECKSVENISSCDPVKAVEEKSKEEEIVVKNSDKQLLVEETAPFTENKQVTNELNAETVVSEPVLTSELLEENCIEEIIIEDEKDETVKVAKNIETITLSSDSEDEWSKCKMRPFSIKEDKKSIDRDLDNIARQFVSKMLLSTLSKPERRGLYQKLVEVTKARKERKERAVRELLEMNLQINPQPSFADIRAPKTNPFEKKKKSYRRELANRCFMNEPKMFDDTKPTKSPRFSKNLMVKGI